MTSNTPTNTNIPEIPLSLKGSFWDKEIAYSAFPVMGNKKVVINIHWTFWNQHGTNGKYHNFATQLQTSGISAVTYGSSRKSEIDDSIVDSYERKKAHFEGKTFEDELSDARAALQHTIENSMELLWVPSEELEITLNGNSLWGILAFYLAQDFPQITDISSVWTGLRLEASDVPILSSLPNPESIREVASKFTGNYSMHQAGSDSVFSPKAYDELYQAVTWEKNRTQYTGVNHSFRSVSGIQSEKPYEKVRERLAALVEWQELSDRTVDLESEVGQATEVLPGKLSSILSPHQPWEEESYIG